jgi:hypothetical protein
VRDSALIQFQVAEAEAKLGAARVFCDISGASGPT